jgi:hypothetical protein
MLVVRSTSYSGPIVTRGLSFALANNPFALARKMFVSDVKMFVLTEDPFEIPAKRYMCNIKSAIMLPLSSISAHLVLEKCFSKFTDYRSHLVLTHVRAPGC